MFLYTSNKDKSELEPKPDPNLAHYHTIPIITFANTHIKEWRWHLFKYSALLGLTYFHIYIFIFAHYLIFPLSHFSHFQITFTNDFFLFYLQQTESITGTSLSFYKSQRDKDHDHPRKCFRDFFSNYVLYASCISNSFFAEFRLVVYINDIFLVGIACNNLPESFYFQRPL